MRKGDLGLIQKWFGLCALLLQRMWRALGRLLQRVGVCGAVCALEQEVECESEIDVDVDADGDIDLDAGCEDWFEFEME